VTGTNTQAHPVRTAGGRELDLVEARCGSAHLSGEYMDHPHEAGDKIVAQNLQGLTNDSTKGRRTIARRQKSATRMVRPKLGRTSYARSRLRLLSPVVQSLAEWKEPLPQI